MFHPPLQGEGCARRAQGGEGSAAAIDGASHFPFRRAERGYLPLQGEVK
jgi:hypothetical protein